MALKRALTNTFLDVTVSHWMDQVNFIASAISRTVGILSGVKVIVVPNKAKRVDATGRASNISVLVQVPDGADQAEDFINGSAVGHALTDPNFKTLMGKIVEQLSGLPSTILEFDTALSQAVEVQASGLIVESPEPSPIIELDFKLVQTLTNQDVYDITPKEDMVSGDIGQINWSETPTIQEFSNRKIYLAIDSFQGSVVDFDVPLLGAWEYTSTEVLSDDSQTPVSSTFITESITSPVSMSIKKDDVEVGTKASSGTFKTATIMQKASTIFLSPSRNSRGIGLFIRDSKNGGRESDTYVEPATIFRSIDTISNSLKITNDGSAPIKQGTVLGQLKTRKDTIAEIF